MNKLFSLFIFPPFLLFGTSFVIESGETVNQQTLADPGDSGLIEFGGTVESATGTPAVRMLNLGQVVRNLAPDGVETATADYKGSFVAGEMAILRQ